MSRDYAAKRLAAGQGIPYTQALRQVRAEVINTGDPMTTTATPERAVRCRYVGLKGDRCLDPAADDSPTAEIVLCTRHLGRALELINRTMKARTGR